MKDSLAPNSTPWITRTDREKQVSVELLGTATKGLMFFSKTISQECWPLPITLTEQKGLIIATTKPRQPYRTFCALSCQGSLSFSNILAQSEATKKKKDQCLQQCKQILCSTVQRVQRRPSTQRTPGPAYYSSPRKRGSSHCLKIRLQMSLVEIQSRTPAETKVWKGNTSEDKEQLRAGPGWAWQPF